MKNYLSLVALFLVSSSAFAMPNVGDDAIYFTTQTSAAGETSSGTSEMKLTAYDSTNDVWTLQQTVFTNGTPYSTDHAVSSQQLLTDELVQLLMSTCAESGGTPGAVTVPAGTFNACAIYSNNTTCTGTMWIAEVAFGLVKKDCTQLNGAHIVTELQSQVMGQ
jgi:hypothetical protein